MAATMIQANVTYQGPAIRRPAISTAALGAVISVAIAVLLLIAMVPGLARVPARDDQPRGLEAPVGASIVSASPVVFVAAPQPGPHPGR